MAQYAENPTFSSDFPEITLISYPNANNDSQTSFSNTNETMANTSIVINEQQIKKSRICHPVWQYLSRNVDNTSIICNLCQQKYSSKTGINTIKGHFMTNHKDEWTMIEQQQTNKSVELYGKKDMKRIIHFNSLLFRWIICDQQSFSVVENDDFIAFITTLDPRYKLPSRQTVSIKIQEIYESQCKILKTYFSKLSSKVAITTDVWTACTNQAYMSVTLHWIDDEWKMYCILLDLVPLHERHTGVTLANTMYTIINDFGLGEKIIAITTDNASNMNVFGQNFTQLLSDNHGNVLSRRVRCAAHILNLVVRDGLDAVGKSIIKARKFAIAIRSSQVLFEELKKIFELKQRPFLVPEIDVSTCWNSTYIMIEKLRKIRELTDILVASNPLLKDISPNDEDWKELDSLVTLLEPVYQATNLLSASNHPTFGDLRTVFLVIANVINEAQETQETQDQLNIMREVAKKMCLKLDKYWDELKNTFHEAVILDPNNKLVSFESVTDKNHACETIRTTYKNFYLSRDDENRPVQPSKTDTGRRGAIVQNSKNANSPFS
ncbi:unnamed protein product [Rhizophagus irregularis]|uniref:Zinc finger bed domain-containing protein ricesleeper 2-like n=1 Tax=Rhizophagus irregularis TaxID=588596 RepID=A0A916EAP3_9GLOM|nr:unnamed protein product [Rhizophagus irregularis]CAB5194292.1 unnamed protein product [Rhizophagus irregularis]CAB5373270.1 unnamed protein product [Rhizophagus irregularis]